jgi:hypothetical protein
LVDALSPGKPTSLPSGSPVSDFSQVFTSPLSLGSTPLRDATPKSVAQAGNDAKSPSSTGEVLCFYVGEEGLLSFRVAVETLTLRLAYDEREIHVAGSMTAFTWDRDIGHFSAQSFVASQRCGDVVGPVISPRHKETKAAMLTARWKLHPPAADVAMSGVVLHLDFAGLIAAVRGVLPSEAALRASAVDAEQWLEHGSVRIPEAEYVSSAGPPPREVEVASKRVLISAEEYERVLARARRAEAELASCRDDFSRRESWVSFK